MRRATYYRLLQIADVIKGLGDATTRDLVEHVPALTIHNANKLLRRHPDWFERTGKRAGYSPLWRLTASGRRQASNCGIVTRSPICGQTINWVSSGWT